MASTFFFILIILPVVALLYLGDRNNKVYKFRIYLIELNYLYGIRQINKGVSFDDTVLIYDKAPSYNRMLFSFKPLELKYWLTEEEIKALTESDEKQ